MNKAISAVLGATLLAAALTLMWFVGPLRSLAGEVSELNFKFVGVGLALSVCAVTTRGLMATAAHQAVGLNVNQKELTITSAVAFAASSATKAGAVGIAVFVRHGNRYGRPAGATTGACLLSGMSSFAAQGVVVAAAVLLLATTGQLAGWWLVASAAFAAYMLAVTGFVALMAKKRETTERVWVAARRKFRAALRRVRKKSRNRTATPDVADGTQLAALFDAFTAARRDPRQLLTLAAFALCSKGLGVAMLAFSVAAVGAPVAWSDAVIVYAAVLAATIVSVLPGGVGPVEGSAVALLVASGSSAVQAATVVALFRLFDLWIPVAVGAALARRELAKKAPASSDA